MRVATWNTHYPFRSGRVAEALRWIDGLQAEVVLLQEAPAPDSEVVLYEQVEIPGRNPWGTAIRSTGVSIARVPLAKTTVPGGAVVGEASSAKGPITFISVYGVFERFLGTIWSIPNLHRIVSDLTPLLVDPKRRGRIILGGDLNAAVPFDTVAPGVPGSHSLLFERLEAFGLKSVLPYRDLDAQTPTWRRGKSGFQNDYLFISEELDHAHPEIAWTEESLSDHAALVVDIDVPMNA